MPAGELNPARCCSVMIRWATASASSPKPQAKVPSGGTITTGLWVVATAKLQLLLLLQEAVLPRLCRRGESQRSPENAAFFEARH